MKRSYKIIIPAIIFGLAILFTIISSFKRTDVFIRDFNYNSESKQLTVYTGVASSAGYIRTMTKSTSEDSVYLIFYPTYGINSSLGAKDTFTLDLDDNIKKIYIYRGGKQQDEYQLALLKNIENSQWETVIPSIDNN